MSGAGRDLDSVHSGLGAVIYSLRSNDMLFDHQVCVRLKAS
jgi:hypothetical protein